MLMRTMTFDMSGDVFQRQYIYMYREDALIGFWCLGHSRHARKPQQWNTFHSREWHWTVDVPWAHSDRNICGAFGVSKLLMRALATKLPFWEAAAIFDWPKRFYSETNHNERSGLFRYSVFECRCEEDSETLSRQRLVISMATHILWWLNMSQLTTMETFLRLIFVSMPQQIHDRVPFLPQFVTYFFVYVMLQVQYIFCNIRTSHGKADLYLHV